MPRHYRGAGPFPATGELEARSESTERILHIFREQIVEADGPRLFRVRRTYLTSRRTRDGKSEPTPVEGKTYEISRPFSGKDFRAERIAEDGARAPATPEENKELRGTTLRMAATLLPEDPVRVGDKWRPGRDTRALNVLGQDRSSMLARLKERKGEFAIIEGTTDVQIPRGPQAGTQVALRESLHVEPETGRLAAYHYSAEQRRAPLRPGGTALWRLGVVDASYEYK